MKYSYLSEYTDKINSGAIIAPKKVITIYNRLVNELDNCSWEFRSDRANRAIKFIETFCKHSKGEWAGRPIKLELFQKAFICALFGIVNKETGLRRFRQAFFMLGRKNGKSTLMAGIALYMLMADGEKGAEVYSIATKLDQAKLVYNMVVNMMLQSPELKKNLRKRVSHIEFEHTMSIFKPLATDSKTLDGLNANCVILDELHALRDREIYEVMLQAVASRREPLLVMITTAGTVRENIFDDLYNYSKNIINKTFEDDTFLPVIYELDSKEEWIDQKAWIKANPALGVTKKIEYLQEKVNQAKNNPSNLSGLLTKDFNIIQNSATAWLKAEDILYRAEFDIKELEGSYFIGGVDLSQVNDLTCATALMYNAKTDKICVEQMYFLPETKIEEHEQSDKVPYKQWIDKGYLRVSEGGIVDYSMVTAWFNELVEEKGISPYKIYYDRWKGDYWIKEMEEEGYPLVACAQGAKTFSTPMRYLEADLKARRVIFNNNPILQWCLSNTTVKVDDNENIRPIKGGTRYQRIDGMVALLNAYVGYVENLKEFQNLVSYE